MSAPGLRASRRSCLLASCAFGFLPFDAQAQETRLEAVTVTAVARDTRDLQTTAAAVAVVDAVEIERRLPSTYQELLGDTPGVEIEGGPRGIAQEPNIRGFRDEQVVIRIDGARQNFNLAHRGRFFVDPDILGRVEVVRGGASAIYGSATVYGDAGRVDGLAFIGWRDMGDDLDDGEGDPIIASELEARNALLKLGIEPTEALRLEANVQNIIIKMRIFSLDLSHRLQNKPLIKVNKLSVYSPWPLSSSMEASGFPKN